MELIPLKSIGPFEFGKSIDHYKMGFDFSFKEGVPPVNWDSYALEKEGVSISTENSIIEAIFCDRTCTYLERNLLGMEIDEFIEFYGLEYDEDIDEIDFEEDEDEPQFVYEFESMGLQLWVKRGTIVMVIASGLERG